MFQHQHIRDLTIRQHFSLSPPRLAFLAWGDLTRARVSLALLSQRKNGDYSSLLYVWKDLLPRVKNPGGKKPMVTAYAPVYCLGQTHLNPFPEPILMHCPWRHGVREHTSTQCLPTYPDGHTHSYESNVSLHVL